jgi:hypothetical protein
MKINIDKSLVMRVSKSNESLQIKENNLWLTHRSTRLLKVNNRELKEVDHLNTLEVC